MPTFVDGRRQYEEGEWEREYRALTLRDVWPVVVQAWRARRSNRGGRLWSMIANNVNYVRCEQEDEAVNGLQAAIADGATLDVLLELARAGRRDDFCTLAGSAGVPRKSHAALWTGTRKRLGQDEVGKAARRRAK